MGVCVGCVLGPGSWASIGQAENEPFSENGRVEASPHTGLQPSLSQSVNLCCFVCFVFFFVCVCVSVCVCACARGWCTAILGVSSGCASYEPSCASAYSFTRMSPITSTMMSKV